MREDRLRRLEARVKAAKIEGTVRVRLANGFVVRVPEGAAFDVWCEMVEALREGRLFDASAYPLLPILRRVVETEPGRGCIEPFLADCLRAGLGAP